MPCRTWPASRTTRSRGWNSTCRTYRSGANSATSRGRSSHSPMSAPTGCGSAGSTRRGSIWSRRCGCAAPSARARPRSVRSSTWRCLRCGRVTRSARWRSRPRRSKLASAMQAREFEADAWCTRGDAELALGHPQAAAAAFERAESLATTIGHGRRHHALAGRARVAHGAGRPIRRTRWCTSRLCSLGASAGETWYGADARLVLWTCHRLLAQAGDPRAPGLLADAQAELQARAATISDATLRASFLANVPHHRAIAAAWTAVS